MTREEALNILHNASVYHPDYLDALNMAIKALEQEPKILNTLDFAIDADELLKRISEKAKTPSLSEDTVNGLCGATAIIFDMLNESEDKE